MIYMKKIAIVSAVALALTSCQQPGQQGGFINKEGLGTIMGAVGGGLVGSQIGKGSGKLAAVGVGTLLGAALGNSLGSTLDKIDMMHYSQTSQTSLETGKSGVAQTWHNPDSGNSGTFTPTRTYQQADGRYCREYQQTITVGGKTQKGYGTACRQPDGSWQIIE